MSKKVNNRIKQEKYYSKIIINKAKRWFTFIAILFLVTMLASILFTNMLLDKSWIYMIVPTIAIGLFAMAIPQAEEWEYIPWQSKPRVYEQEK